MNIRDALAQASDRLEREAAGPARPTAEVLMQHVLDCDKAYLYAHPEQELSRGHCERYEQALARRLRGEPTQYITGKQEFWGLDFIVSPAVLIPRPETEHLVEAAIEIAGGYDVPRIVDVGTGSGAIILALAHELTKRGRKAELHATDISGEALGVAKENARRFAITGVNFSQADLLAPFTTQPAGFDLVLSNPPYVGLNEQDKVQREVREHEPRVAVFGGEEGLDIYRRLIPQAASVLKPGGRLLMEIGYSIEPQVRALLEGWVEVATIADLQGIPRVVKARKA